MSEERELRETLRTMAAEPDPERAALAAAAVGDAVRAVARPRHGIRRSLLAVVVLGLVAGLALSPPGRAVAERLGELVGVGEESSVTDPNLRDPRLNASQHRIGPAIVTAVGSVPGTGEPYEILAWAARSKESIGPASPGGDEILSCTGIVYPDMGRQETAKSCNATDERAESGTIGFGAADLDGFEAPYAFYGTTDPAVSRVVLGYRGRGGAEMTVDATLGVIDEEVMERTGADQRLGFYAAYAPYDGAQRGRSLPNDSRVLRSATITAFDAGGNELSFENLGARFKRDLERGDRERTGQSFLRDPESGAAMLVICGRFRNRIGQPSQCDAAEAAARREPKIADLAGRLTLSVEDDVATVELPRGGSVVAELGPE